jgi:hypothetical protein
VNISDKQKNALIGFTVWGFIAGVVAIPVVFSLWLHNTGLYALPDEERYQFINVIKDGLDYESSGKVLEAGYDTGDGVFATSYFYAEIEGDETFAVLTERLQAIPGVECTALLDYQTSCHVGQAHTAIVKDDTKPGNIIKLNISDTSGGRHSG